MFVVLNYYPASITLENKHNEIEYNIFREVVAAGFIRLEHLILENNYADILTKSLSGSNHCGLCKSLIFHIMIYTKDWHEGSDRKA